MVGFGGDEEVEPSDGFNVGSERGERSQCWSLGVETEHLGEWGRQRQKGNEGFTLKSVTFAITGLVFRDDLVLHCGGTLPTPVWGDLQFRDAWLRSSVKSQGGPTRIYKLSHLFISWFELVVVADFSGRNGRIRP